MKRVFIILAVAALSAGCYKSEFTNVTLPDDEQVDNTPIKETTDDATVDDWAPEYGGSEDVN